MTDWKISPVGEEILKQEEKKIPRQTTSQILLSCFSPPSFNIQNECTRLNFIGETRSSCSSEDEKSRGVVRTGCGLTFPGYKFRLRP